MIEVGRIKPDLLILDIKIPGVDGVEVCRCIKADATNKTAIIAISGAGENEATILQAGADAFMDKPIELDRLYTEARRLLRVL
jgi:DNA-binding response OmpR family regulator